MRPTLMVDSTSTSLVLSHDVSAYSVGATACRPDTNTIPEAPGLRSVLHVMHTFGRDQLSLASGHGAQTVRLATLE
jgi:hypothetical protein